jgi:hypothetical protein
MGYTPTPREWRLLPDQPPQFASSDEPEPEQRSRFRRTSRAPSLAAGDSSAVLAARPGRHSHSTDRQRSLDVFLKQVEPALHRLLKGGSLNYGCFAMKAAMNGQLATIFSLSNLAIFKRTTGAF